MNGQIVQKDNQRFYIIVMTICLAAAVAVTCGSFISIAKNKAPEKEVYKYYTSIQIEKGDTLWELAEDYITTEYNSVNDYIQEVKNLNSLYGDSIHEGQYLTVPYYSSQVLD
ncbi:cell division suppressor protein YneA [Konateibacter massiliensis]|uniref:cell division suppressor protein YneA n=1 Tax=Konateibacter massiliensis TaxID=2002841 RepID=UPI000C150B4C|nr:LysM peptidoglycan-binding domain-containing protein [Konateibacter massiliensis]